MNGNFSRKKTHAFDQQALNGVEFNTLYNAPASAPAPVFCVM